MAAPDLNALSILRQHINNSGLDRPTQVALIAILEDLMKRVRALEP